MVGGRGRGGKSLGASKDQGKTTVPGLPNSFENYTTEITDEQQRQARSIPCKLSYRDMGRTHLKISAIACASARFRGNRLYEKRTEATVSRKSIPFPDFLTPDHGWKAIKRARKDYPLAKSRTKSEGKAAGVCTLRLSG